MRSYVIALVAILLTGCVVADGRKDAPDTTFRSAIVLVPGYYGTQLIRQSDGAVIWISVAQALLGDVPLTLPIQGLGFHDAIPLQADGILEKVPIIPLLYDVDAYGSMQEVLQAYGREGVSIVTFSYDWRDDLMVNVRKLATVIQDLRTAGTRDVRLVAHSMGGLLAAYYLRYGTQDPDRAVETWEGAAYVTGVVLAGVPFKGTMIAFRNSQYGVTIGLNRTLLQPTAVASFPATYYLLPAEDVDVLLTTTLQPIPHAVRNGIHWIMHRWGLLKQESLPEEVVARRETYTLEWLARSARFSALLLKPVTTRLPLSIPMLSITGRGQPTLNTGIWDERAGTGRALIFDEDGLAKAAPEAEPAVLYKDGDGTVTTESAMLPVAFARTFQTVYRQYEVGHMELMTRPVIQKDIIAFLSAGRSIP